MNLVDLISNAQGGAALQEIGSQLGLGPQQTTTALAALVPALAAGFQRNAQSTGGLDGLLSALSNGQHARYLDNPAVLGRADTITDGNGILGHVFGSKDVSRQVASRAATQTGLSEDVLKRMLPMVAALIMGAMARQATQGGGRLAQPAASGGGLMGMLGATLDQNRDGSMIDDVIGLLGRSFSR
ncbi:MAG TPA: DUF937 domain-containing protein [Vicinamibacterales bacterium]|jgi:hypothetical protein